MKFNPKLCLKVVGKMNSKDAGTVGKMLAVAVIIAATLFGIAAVISSFH